MEARKTSDRQLTANERASLVRILKRAPRDDGAQLSAQVEHARVVGGSDTFLELRVDEHAPHAFIENGHVPVRAFVAGSEDDEPDAELLVWVKNATS
jgi:hypothetical protein